MIRNVLFADDDCEGFLAPLARMLAARPQVSLNTAVTFRDALDVLQKGKGAPNTAIQSMLLDIVLPYDRNGRGALMSDLGIKLAEQAAELGVKTIVFLTVVRRDEMEDRFSELKKKYEKKVDFGYFDKTELLARAELNNLLDFVTPTTKE